MLLFFILAISFFLLAVRDLGIGGGWEYDSVVLCFPAHNLQVISEKICRLSAGQVIYMREYYEGKLVAAFLLLL